MLAFGPVVVGYVPWRGVLPTLSVADRLSRIPGIAAAALFSVLLLFSTGQFTLAPDTGANDPEEGFVVLASFANPLVSWPAVEFYDPSIPLFGALSIGTVAAFALLAGLVGVNASLAAVARASSVEVGRSRGLLAGLATTGATTFRCCAPAFSGVASALVGVSASPPYWAFLDPASPAGRMFFVAAMALMTASAVGLARSLGVVGVSPPGANAV